MIPVIVALLVLALAILGVYLLLKSMGEDGVEAAAPGSCKSGRCGVQLKSPVDADVVDGADAVDRGVKIIQMEDFRRRTDAIKPPTSQD
jgi:hypothetical protein